MFHSHWKYRNCWWRWRTSKYMQKTLKLRLLKYQMKCQYKCACLHVTGLAAKENKKQLGI